MKRYCTVTIICLLILALLPDYAFAGIAALPAEAAHPDSSASFPEPLLSAAPDQLSKLYQEYTVKRGDNLISIGKQFGVPWRDLAALNGIQGPRYLVIIGQTLKIPLLPKLPGTSGNLLILCETEAQKRCLAEFVTYKILNGYSVTVKSVEADVKHKANADTSEEIRQYLKKMDQELSLEYVLLVGCPYDEEPASLQHTGGIIPMRYLYDNPANRDYSWYDGNNGTVIKTPSDIYYAYDINWDSDKDGFAGEKEEMAKTVEQAKPELMFKLGRIPLSDTKDIGMMLNSTMRYETDQKSHSDALIVSYGIWAYYSEALAKNLSEASIEAVTLYGDGGGELCQYKSTYPLSIDNFKREASKKYDFVYTMGDYERLGKSLQAGFIFIDSSTTMNVEPSLGDKFTAEAVLANGSVCAAIATTGEVGMNPKRPALRLASRLFSNKSTSVSDEFYAAAQASILEGDMLEAYSYCYLGDPSIGLKP